MEFLDSRGDGGARSLLEAAAAGVAPRPMDDPSLGPEESPEAVLERMLGLSATVRVADHLVIVRPSGLPPASTGSVRARVEKKVEELRAEMASSFAAPFKGRRPLPDAVTVARTAEGTTALTARDPAALRALARALAPLARERFDHQLTKFRQRIRWFRTDVAPELRRAGERAQRLEMLDAVVARALEPGVSALQARVEARLDQVFEARFVAAVLALPAPATDGDTDTDTGTDTEADAAPRAAAPVDLAPLFAPRGMMLTHARLLGQLLQTLVDAELDLFYALLDAPSAPAEAEAHP